MAQLETDVLEQNLTNKYNPDCSHLDDWKDLGKITLLKQTVVDDDGEYVRTESFFFFQGFDVVDPDTIASALRTKFRASCSCEHDCCGCATGYAYEVDRIDPNIWRVLNVLSPNY